MSTAWQRLGSTRRAPICNCWCSWTCPRQTAVNQLWCTIEWGSSSPRALKFWDVEMQSTPLVEQRWERTGNWEEWNRVEGCFSLGILARQGGKHFPEANCSGWWVSEQVPLSTDAVAETNFPFHWNLEALRSNFRLGVAMVFCQEIKLSYMQVFLGCF